MKISGCSNISWKFCLLTSIFDNSSTKAIEAVYRANLQIFEEVIPTEIEEIKEEEEEMLASSIREAMDILANDKGEYVPPPILEPFGKFCYQTCGYSQCYDRLHWRTVQQWRVRGFV